MAKRIYQTRKGEFYDLSIDQLKVELEKVATQLSDVLKEQRTTKTEDNEKVRKELNNKRIRIYSRLRKLGYNSSEFRGNGKSAIKVEPVVSPETQKQLDEIAAQKKSEEEKVKQEVVEDHKLEPEKRSSQEDLPKQEEGQQIVQKVDDGHLIVSNTKSDSLANKRIILSVK